MNSGIPPMGERRKPDESAAGERRETIEELTELLSVVQQMGHRLAYETHNDHYDMVKELNGRLHQARLQLEEIRKTLLNTGA